MNVPVLRKWDAAVLWKRWVDGTYIEGKALPIAYARLKVAKFDQTVPVTDTDKVISFTVTLPSGPTDLQTWFLDSSRKLLTGAYYVPATHAFRRSPGIAG